MEFHWLTWTACIVLTLIYAKKIYKARTKKAAPKVVKSKSCILFNPP